MNLDDRRVRIFISMIGLAFVIASLVVTFRLGSTTWGWALLLIGLALALALRWKR